MAIIRAERSSIDLARFSWVTGMRMMIGHCAAMGKGAAPGSGAGEDGGCIDEADRVAERILCVKGSFAPRALLDAIVDPGATRAASAVEGCLQIIHREVDVLGVGADVRVVAVGGGVVAGEDGAAAIEVVTARGDAAARLVQH